MEKLPLGISGSFPVVSLKPALKCGVSQELVFESSSVGKAAGRYRSPAGLRLGRTPCGTQEQREVRREIFKNPFYAICILSSVGRAADC